MRIVVLNGSPKGATSITMQHATWLAGEFPEHRFVVLHVARRVERLAKDPAALEEVLEEVRSADGVLWAFPLYIGLVCSQYKRFIELAYEPEAAEAFRGKYAAALSTSIHFFDQMAQQYIHSVCDDLGMAYTGFYAAGMQDVLKEEERRRFRGFGRDFLESIAAHMSVPVMHAALPAAALMFEPGAPSRRVETRGRRIVILTDGRPEDRNLGAMTRRLAAAFDGPVETVNIREVGTKGGCLGCLRCGPDNHCAWEGKDGFIDFYNTKLKTADILVFAGTLVARQLSWKWRELFDRSFFNTHQPSLSGKQVAFLISGPLSRVPELRTLYEAWMEFQRSNLVAFLSDEAESSSALEAQLDGLAERLVRLSEEGYVRPMTFLGVGGMKLFRDDIWAELRIVFAADHKYYRKAGYYDFPQRHPVRMLLIRLLALVTSIPAIRDRMASGMKQFMIMPYRRLLAGRRGLEDPQSGRQKAEESGRAA
jgi:multimeric flavodoxin WrbA